MDKPKGKKRDKCDKGHKSDRILTCNQCGVVYCPHCCVKTFDGEVRPSFAACPNCESIDFTVND
jgi:transcription elongation factor Elf1